MHYDPAGKSSAKTKKEIEEEKDPILFGVFKESRRLYYIGDWIDEYCNLTMNEVAKLLGKKSVYANDIGENIELK